MKATRLLFTLGSFLCLAGWQPLSAAVGEPGAAKGGEHAHLPNIVLYLSDDHGIDFVGCYGNSVVRTPNIDGLAREGVKFNRVFAASPTCSQAFGRNTTAPWEITPIAGRAFARCPPGYRH